MCSDPDGHVSDSEYRLPDWFAAALMSQLRPTGRIVVPGAESSSGAFVRALQGHAEVSGCEAVSADDFLSWAGRVDWVITNPPWNNFRKFLVHALEIADHIAMLVTVNHWWTQRRVADVRNAGFGYRRLILCDWPPECASNGFQLGLMVVSRGHTGPLAVEWLRTTHNTRPQFGQTEGRFVPRRRRPNDPSQGELLSKEWDAACAMNARRSLTVLDQRQSQRQREITDAATADHSSARDHARDGSI